MDRKLSAVFSATAAEGARGVHEREKQAVGLERTRHEVGDALLIELLDAEVSLRRAETAHAAAICSHNRTQHLLRQALGG